MHGDIGQALLADNEPAAQQLLARAWAALFPEPLLHRAAARRQTPSDEAYVQRARAAGCARSSCRWWPPIRCSSSRPRTSRRTRRACASPRARCWPTSAARGCSRPSSTSRRRREMAELFADMPAALANSVEIARRCNLELELGKAQLPHFPTPDDLGLDEYLRSQAAGRPRAAAGSAVSRRGGARAQRRRAIASGSSSRSRPSSRWASPATS